MKFEFRLKSEGRILFVFAVASQGLVVDVVQVACLLCLARESGILWLGRLRSVSVSLDI